MDDKTRLLGPEGELDVDVMEKNLDALKKHRERHNTAFWWYGFVIAGFIIACFLVHNHWSSDKYNNIYSNDPRIEVTNTKAGDGRTNTSIGLVDIYAHLAFQNSSCDPPGPHQDIPNESLLKIGLGDVVDNTHPEILIYNPLVDAFSVCISHPGVYSIEYLLVSRFPSHLEDLSATVCSYATVNDYGDYDFVSTSGYTCSDKIIAVHASGSDTEFVEAGEETDDSDLILHHVAINQGSGLIKTVTDNDCISLKILLSANYENVLSVIVSSFKIAKQ